MINVYPQQVSSGGVGNTGSAPTPIDSFIIGSLYGQPMLTEGTYKYLKTGVVTLAAVYPSSATAIASYPTTSVLSSSPDTIWKTGNFASRIVGTTGNVFSYSDDGGVTIVAAGNATNSGTWSKPDSMFYSKLFSKYIAFGTNGRWVSNTGIGWFISGTHTTQPSSIARMQYTEGNGKGIAVTMATVSNSPVAYVTSNANSWVEVATPIHFQDITYHAPTTSFYALGTDGFIYVTSDGATWALQNGSANFGNWIYSDGTNLYCLNGTSYKVSIDNAVNFSVAVTLKYGASFPVAGLDTTGSKVVINGSCVLYTNTSASLYTFTGTDNVPTFNLGATVNVGSAPAFTSTNGYLVTNAETVSSTTSTLSIPVYIIDNWKQLDSGYGYTTLYKRVA